MEVSISAGKIVGMLYDAFAKQYIDPTSERSLKSLNMLCVRLVFCLNFPWPDATDEQKAEIENLAQGVLDARASYPDSTLADMYGETSMLFHTTLLNAHRELDRAVMKLYGFSVKETDEAACVAALMEMYRKLAGA